MLKSVENVRIVETRPLRLEVRLHNRPHIAAAFGDEACEFVRSGMLAAISRFLASDLTRQARVALAPTVGGRASVRYINGDLIAIDVEASSLETDVSLLVEGLSRTLAVEPIIWGTARIHVAPSVRIAWRGPNASMDDAMEAGLVPVASEAPFAGEPVLGAPGWCDLYQRDMAVAAQLFEDLTAGRLRLAFQPICMAGRFGSVLYQECLLSATDGGESRRSPADVIAALERLGLMRVLDNHVARMALVELRGKADLRLGVNISAQSAIVDGWWAAVRTELEAAPQLAERLTIEITETATLPSLAAAVGFVAWMKSVRCNVALDDFGAGRDAIRNLYALTPDIVKVDAFFLHQARGSKKGLDAFKSLVSLSRAVGGAVVVEGVETSQDSRIAVEAGAPWQQGRFFGGPRPAAIARGRDSGVSEPRPAFGRRPNAPNLHIVKMDNMDNEVDAFAGGAAALPQQAYFNLRSLRWAAPLSAALWGLIGWAVWLSWKGLS